MKVFSVNEEKSFEKVDDNAEFCYVSMLNSVKFCGNAKTEQMLKFYRKLIKSGQTQLIENQDKEFLSKVCGREGLRLIDYAIIDGNYEFVKFLYENCDAEINAIPFQQFVTSIYYVLENIKPEKDDKLIEHAKIIGYLIREGAYAFILNNYEYDEEDLEDGSKTDFEFVLENIRYSTITIIGEYLNECVEALGTNPDLDDKLITAIDIYARLGFMPYVDTMLSKNYSKYQLDNIFEIENRNIKISNKLACVMKNYVELYYAIYDELFDATIKSANIEAGTYKVVDIGKDGSYVVLDYSNQEASACIDVDEFEELDDDELNGLDEIRTYDEDEEFDSLDNIHTYNNDELQEIIDNAELASEEELQLSEEEEAELDEMIEGDGYITKYDFYELTEIANRNLAYLEECKCLKMLYSNDKKFNKFVKTMDKADNYNYLKKFMSDRIHHLKMMMACRFDDSVDDMLDPEIESETEMDG